MKKCNKKPHLQRAPGENKHEPTVDGVPLELLSISKNPKGKFGTALPETTYERLTRDPIRKAEIEEEGVILDLADEIYMIMVDEGPMFYNEVAGRAGVTVAELKNLIYGADGVTIRTLVKVAQALGRKVVIKLEKKG